MNTYKFFLELHSGFRYIVLVLLLLAIIMAWAGWLGKKSFSEGQRKLNLFTLISVHTQLLIGLVLYFLSPFVQFNSQTMKDDTTRYWTVEHEFLMIIALALVHVGRVRIRKSAAPASKHRAAAIFVGVAMLLVLLGIPWPGWANGRPLLRW